MADRVQIRSIDDIERFRAQLLTFLSGARAAVEEVTMDVARQQAWLDLDRRKYWEGEHWRRQRKLEEARQSRFQDSISTQRGPAGWLQMQVHRAEQSLDEAKSKLSQVKAWSRNFEQRSLPMVKQIEQLQTALTVDMAHAVNFLNQTLATLDAYIGRPSSPPPGGTHTAIISTPGATAPELPSAPMAPEP